MNFTNAIPRLLVIVTLILISGGTLSLWSQNPAFEMRRASYNGSALVNANSNSICIQAFEGVPVDQSALNDIVSVIDTDYTIDFKIVKLIRILFLANGTYDSLLVPALNSIPYWVNNYDTVRNFWSENHLIMWMSSDWLMHEKYGRPIDPNLEDRLVHYLELKNQFGFYEFNSSTYAPYTLSGLLNLADFASDTLIKSLATSAAERLLKEEILLLTNDQGVMFPAAGRNYYSKYDNPYGQNHNSLIWLLTGLGPAPQQASHSGAFLSTTSIPVDDLVNAWTTDVDTILSVGHSLDSGFVINSNLADIDRVMFQWSSGGYFHPDVALETGRTIEDSNMWDHVDFETLNVFGTFFEVDSFPGIAEDLSFLSRSSVISGQDIAVFKRGGVTLSSAQNFWPGKVGYQQYPWVANVGTSAVFAISGTPDADWYARNDNNANGHLPYVEQSGNVALIMYWPEEKPSLFHTLLDIADQTVSLHFRDTDFDEVVQDSLWIMGRQGNNYVGIRRACTDTVNGLWACDAPDGQGWACVVGDANLYGSFANFQSLIAQAQFEEQWYHDGTQQEWVYYASVTFDNTSIDHAWGRDSVLATSAAPVLSPSHSFQVFPNPAQDRISIAGEIASTGNIHLRLMDLNGRVLDSQIHKHPGGSFETSFDLKSLRLSKGIYGLEIRGKNTYDFMKLVIE